MIVMRHEYAQLFARLSDCDFHLVHGKQVMYIIGFSLITFVDSSGVESNNDFRLILLHF